MAKPRTSNAVWIAAIGAATVVIVAGFWLYAPRPPQPECAFSGWQRTLGIDLDTQVQQIEAVKTKIGISDAQVREFDTLMRDYALKYDSACQDVSATPPRMSQDEYTCLRRNMTDALDAIRRFTEAAKAASSIADASAQKEIVLKSLAQLETAHAAGYRTNCTSGIAVDPKKMSFAGVVPERSIQISNRGNNDFTFTVERYPEGFEPKPPTGRVPKGATASVAMFRTLLPVPETRPLTFHVTTNLDDDAEVEIAVDTPTAEVWKALGEKATAIANAGNPAGAQPPTIEHMVQAVSESLKDDSTVTQADRYVLASNALFVQRRDADATTAIETAAKTNPAILQQPSVLNLRALIAVRSNKPPDEGLKLLAESQRVEKSQDATTRVMEAEKVTTRKDRSAVITPKNLTPVPVERATPEKRQP